MGPQSGRVQRRETKGAVQCWTGEGVGEERSSGLAWDRWWGGVEGLASGAEWGRQLWLALGAICKLRTASVTRLISRRSLSCRRASWRRTRRWRLWTRASSSCESACAPRPARCVRTTRVKLIFRDLGWGFYATFEAHFQRTFRSHQRRIVQLSLRLRITKHRSTWTSTFTFLETLCMKSLRWKCLLDCVHHCNAEVCSRETEV